MFNENDGIYLLCNALGIVFSLVSRSVEHTLRLYVGKFDTFRCFARMPTMPYFYHLGYFGFDNKHYMLERAIVLTKYTFKSKMEVFWDFFQKNAKSVELTYSNCYASCFFNIGLNINSLV